MLAPSPYAIAAERLTGSRTLTWRSVARREQLPPDGDWRTWLILAGRGWGKSRTGAETLKTWAAAGKARRIALVAQTAADVRDVSIDALLTRIEGFDRYQKPILGREPDMHYEPSKRRLTFPDGAVATTFSAEDPDSLRGYQVDTAWLDELAAWRFPDSYDQLQYGLRMGWARQIVTTTPRPIPLLRTLMAEATTETTRGRTMDNAANLAESTIAYLVSKYAGTRLGRQELDGELIEDQEGALWKRAMIDLLRVSSVPALERIVVGVDPAATSNADSDETGIVVDGLAQGHGFTLDDASLRGTPHDWATAAIAAFHKWKANLIVAEANNGGEMVSHVIHTIDPNVPVKLVHAAQGKQTRAEPVSALYEQGRWHHVGFFAALEDQQCQWDPRTDRYSPDRLDAHVWAAWELTMGNAWSSDVVSAIA